MQNDRVYFQIASHGGKVLAAHLPHSKSLLQASQIINTADPCSLELISKAVKIMPMAQAMLQQA